MCYYQLTIPTPIPTIPPSPPQPLDNARNHLELGKEKNTFILSYIKKDGRTKEMTLTEIVKNFDLHALQPKHIIDE